VADGQTNLPALRSDRTALVKRLSEFQQFQPELPAGIMDPDVEDRRKFAAFAHIMFYDPILFSTQSMPRFWKSLGRGRSR